MVWIAWMSMCASLFLIYIYIYIYIYIDIYIYIYTHTQYTAALYICFSCVANSVVVE